MAQMKDDLIASMGRVNQLLDDEEYYRSMQKINVIEKERLYCKHGFEHGLNVARIAYAYLLEQGDNFLSKELVYAAALLHDIGRWVEYETGEDHAEASVRLALPILKACQYNTEDIQVILIGIREHRLHHEAGLTSLGKALALADDWSRDCRNCSAQSSCYKFVQAMKQITF